MKYRILFLGYWNVDDPLTHATIFPNLNLLLEFSNVEYLHFANVQRKPIEIDLKTSLYSKGISYTPLYSKNFRINLLNKINDFILFPRLVRQLCCQHKINFIIARGALAGSLAYLVHKQKNIPFVVESFEPHAEYMKYSGTWKSFDLRFIGQHYWEKKQKQAAKALVVVSENYKEKLISENVSEKKIFISPCTVDSELFFPDPGKREIARGELKISNETIVGLYAGKFGDLYYDDEAFLLFRVCFKVFKDNFHLILLTAHDRDFIHRRFAKFGIPPEKVTVLFVLHTQVPKYLNCADFAFAPIKKTPVSVYQSPVKIGEYLSCGLPVILTDGVGDESSFIEKEKAGVIIRQYEESYLQKQVENFRARLKYEFNPDNLHELIKKYRTPDKTREAYKNILN